MSNKNNKFFLNSGSTLIEILIASMIITLVLTAVAITMMRSLKTEALNRYRQTAVDLANEGLEFLNFQRASLGWNEFITTYGPADPDGQLNSCFGQDGTEIAAGYVVVNAGECDENNADHVINYAGIAFLRNVQTSFVVSDTDITKLQVRVSMSWRPDEKGVRTYQLSHEFSQQDY